jgi:uncharacterized tellurite resistance protein B-like protein
VFLRRILGLPPEPNPEPDAPREAVEGAVERRSDADAHETETVRRIVARLESFPSDRARLLASMAYVLARAAYADLAISDVETRSMEEILVSQAGLDEAQAVLVAEMAKIQARTYGQTEDYLVTREFRERSTPEQRLALLRACFVIGAADDGISASESATLNEIANELGVDRETLARIRGEYAGQFAAERMLHRGVDGPNETGGA